MGECMKRKYTESEIETFQKIGVALFIGSLIALVILSHFNKAAGYIAMPFLSGLTIFLLSGNFFKETLLEHNKELDKYEVVKLQAKAQAEAERIRTQSQIWVNE